jgi:muconolactone delta-isomerase
MVPVEDAMGGRPDSTERTGRHPRPRTLGYRVCPSTPRAAAGLTAGCPGIRYGYPDEEETKCQESLSPHAVQDVDRWLKGQAERAAALPGATDVTDLVAIDGSNHAAVAFDVDDLDALKAVLSSVPPEMAAQAESHGVIVPTMTAYVQA